MARDVQQQQQGMARLGHGAFEFSFAHNRTGSSLPGTSAGGFCSLDERQGDPFLHRLLTSANFAKLSKYAANRVHKGVAMWQTAAGEAVKEVLSQQPGQQRSFIYQSKQHQTLASGDGSSSSPPLLLSAAVAAAPFPLLPQARATSMPSSANPSSAAAVQSLPRVERTPSLSLRPSQSQSHSQPQLQAQTRSQAGTGATRAKAARNLAKQAQGLALTSDTEGIGHRAASTSSRSLGSGSDSSAMNRDSGRPCLSCVGSESVRCCDSGKGSIGRLACRCMGRAPGNSTGRAASGGSINISSSSSSTSSGSISSTSSGRRHFERLTQPCAVHTSTRPPHSAVTSFSGSSLRSGGASSSSNSSSSMAASVTTAVGRDVTPQQHLVAGGLAGMASRTATAPLETVRLRMMTAATTAEATAAANAARPSLSRTAQTLWREAGWRAFFRGNFLNVLRAAPQKAIDFYAFETFKRGLKDAFPQAPDSARVMASGALAGAVSTLVLYPLDVLRSRMTVDAASMSKYRTVAHAAVAIARQEGAQALYKGLAPSLLSILPEAAIAYGCSDLLKSAYQKATRADRVEPLPALVCGVTSAFAGQLVAYPLEVIARQAQVSASSHAHAQAGVLQAARQLVRREGLGGLYRGIVPASMKLLPMAVITFGVYESVKAVLAKMEAERSAAEEAPL